MLAILDEYKHHLDNMSCDHSETVAIYPMNSKKYWHLSQGHSYIYFLFSLLKPQEKQKILCWRSVKIKLILTMQNERHLLVKPVCSITSSWEKTVPKCMKSQDLCNSNLMVCLKNALLFIVINFPQV